MPTDRQHSAALPGVVGAGALLSCATAAGDGPRARRADARDGRRGGASFQPGIRPELYRRLVLFSPGTARGPGVYASGGSAFDRTRLPTVPGDGGDYAGLGAEGGRRAH